MTNYVPADYPVKPLYTPAEFLGASDLMMCGDCGRHWDDAIPTSMTPVPGGRCPFESFHEPRLP